jgi:hypothetical protein
VTKVSTDQKLQATGVIYKNTWTGEQEAVEGTIIVMSGGGIETPRLWLNSNLPENPWVGKGLINHWFDCVSGIFDKDTLVKTVNSTNINPFVGQNAAARFDYPGLGVIETFGMSPGIFSSMSYGTGKIGSNQSTSEPSDKLWDYEGAITKEKLKEFMYDYRRTLSVLIFTDDEVNQTNGVTLDYEHRDEYGFIPRITYNPSQRDKEKRDKLAILAADILRKAGAKTVIRANWPADVFIHIQCTMRMGYVTDINCEAKQVNRLYIADNSVLYNGLGGPNPTLTTQALATRTAEKIVEKYL